MDQQSPTYNGPGVAPTTQTTSQQPKNLRIDAPCLPVNALGGLAVLLPCGGTLTATANHPVFVQAQQVTRDGQTVGSVKTVTLQPAATMTLDAPASGHAWQILDMTQGQANGIALGVLGGLVLAGGLAIYGSIRLVEDRVAAHRRKTAQKRFARWFWGG